LDIKLSNFVVSLNQNVGNEITVKLIDFETSVLLSNTRRANLDVLVQMRKAPEIREYHSDRQDNV